MCALYTCVRTVEQVKKNSWTNSVCIYLKETILPGTYVTCSVFV